MWKKLKSKLKKYWWAFLVILSIVAAAIGILIELVIIKKDEVKVNVKDKINKLKKRNRKLNEETEDFIKESNDFLDNNPPYKL